MALQISECQGVFSVHGSLHIGNAAILEQHMTGFMNPSRPVILNLDRVKSMDTHAARMLTTLHAFATRRNSLLSIIGKENKNILPVMEKTKTAYILSNDRI